MAAQVVLIGMPVRSIVRRRSRGRSGNRPPVASMISGAGQLEGSALGHQAGARPAIRTLAASPPGSRRAKRNDEPVTDPVGNHRVANGCPDRRPMCRMVEAQEVPGAGQAQHQQVERVCWTAESGRGTGGQGIRANHHDIPGVVAALYAPTIPVLTSGGGAARRGA